MSTLTLPLSGRLEVQNESKDVTVACPLKGHVSQATIQQTYSVERSGLEEGSPLGAGLIVLSGDQDQQLTTRQTQYSYSCCHIYSEHGIDRDVLQLLVDQ